MTDDELFVLFTKLSAAQVLRVFAVWVWSLRSDSLEHTVKYLAERAGWLSENLGE